MKILQRIGIVVGALVVLFVVVGLCLPRRYHVERSVEINAPPGAIYPTISTLQGWPEWTAWTVQKYPDMKVSFEGPESGKDATYSWTGKDVGVGNIKLTAADPATGIKYDLNFDNGKYLSQGGIKLEPVGVGTRATWWNEGDLGFSPIGRYFGLMMDSMMGPDFQEGLNNLKTKTEAANKETIGTKAEEADKMDPTPPDAKAGGVEEHK